MKDTGVNLFKGIKRSCSDEKLRWAIPGFHPRISYLVTASNPGLDYVKPGNSVDGIRSVTEVVNNNAAKCGRILEWRDNLIDVAREEGCDNSLNFDEKKTTNSSEKFSCTNCISSTSNTNYIETTVNASAAEISSVTAGLSDLNLHGMGGGEGAQSHRSAATSTSSNVGRIVRKPLLQIGRPV